MSETNKIQKLEETVKFLRKELESQNMAILRLERALESGEGITGSKEKPSLTLADMEFVLFGVEEKMKKHNELIKNIVISLVGLADLLEEIRDFYKSSTIEIKTEQEFHMKTYQKLLSGSIETIRSEFLLVLRDFREKYPELEKMKIEGNISPKNRPRSQLQTRKVESNEVWTNNQQEDLNQRMENLELLIDQNINQSMNPFFEMLNHLTVKLEQIHQLVLENNIIEEKSTDL